MTGVVVTYLDDFVGTFDGNHHIISNLTVSGGGLFDVGAAGATFTRLDLRNVTVSGSGGNGWSGALVRDALGPVTITFSSVTNAVIQSLLGGNAFAGGFIGFAWHNVTILDSYVTGTVTGGNDSNGWVGGFIGNSDTWVPGSARTLTIQRSFFNGTIQGGTAGNTWAAGMLGSKANNVSLAITDSYVSASVNSGSGGNARAFGFYGGGGIGARSLTRSYFQGTLQDQGVNNASAFGNMTVTASFCVTTCEAPGTNATLEQLRTESFIVAAGWNVSSVWCVSAGGGGPSLKSITFGPNPTQCVSPPATTATVTVTPAYRSTITFGDGTCTMYGALLPASSFFLGYRYLPGASECTRPGYTFTGWARTTAPTVPVDLPLLVDPSDGVRRYFIAGDADLVAIWTANPEPITSLTVFANFFCGPCTTIWLIHPPAPANTAVDVTIDNTPVSCSTTANAFGLTFCQITPIATGKHAITITPRNGTVTGHSTNTTITLNG